jgi:DNA-binding transcriptional LysR family regulator
LHGRVASNQLDLALVWGDGVGVPGAVVARPRMHWVGSATLPWRLDETEPLPLVVFDGPCLFCSAAMAALDQAGIPWRIAFTSPSLAGLWAAAAAGLGLTVRTRYGLPASVSTLDSAGLPALPAVSLSLLRSSAQAPPLVERLASIIVESVQAQTQTQERENEAVPA